MKRYAEMVAEAHDTLIIGAGQSGLAVSWHLTRLGCPHQVLERARVAERWRSERWDSLAFQFPNWSLQLPGFAYDGPDPEGFSGRDAVADFIAAYAAASAAPVRCGVSVTRLSHDGDRFVLETSDGPMTAAQVVIATGPYQRPAIPAALAGQMGAAKQLHAMAYRNPAELPDGAVLVVGSGASGAQIAEDLMRAGRRVYLAVGSHRRAPRRYRGRDFMFWEFALGAFDQPLAQRTPGTVPPLLTGVDGGRDMDLSVLAAQGVTLLGRLAGAGDGRLVFADDRDASLARAEAEYDAFLAACDAHAQAAGLDLPPAAPRPPAAPLPTPLLELDLAAAGVGSVIWATGYRYDFGWVDLPIFADMTTRAEPLHQGGVTPAPGAYLIGLAWLSRRKSSVMMGMGEDAAFVAEHLAARRTTQRENDV
ncbi:NAD(P)-binding domain-containing protein [Phenylobacterium aquaticum]|uniref:NAD(P)-binding domain-containing protein n=1 Tax=Phenylobacterium aquaticum TaxID=1763816 RepID=UPI0026F07901|nr:NAD(P)-binding domain-containing protein [Phenylobacterium aquaticum]